LNIEEIKKIALDHSNTMTETRRHLHMHPELDFDVENTAGYILDVLEKLDIEAEITPCNGVKGLLNCGKEGPNVAFRADMDALPLSEKNDLSYASVNKGAMHACGHDAHMAILIGLAHILASKREEARGSARFIFQPAEETFGGADRMIREGVLEDPHVSSIFSLHVSPDLPAGHAGYKEGKMRAAADMFDITVHGFSSHGAEPHRGVDGIVVSTRIIDVVQHLVSRRVSPLDSAVITFGTLTGGTARNILADKVTMSGIIRTLDENTRIMIRKELAKIVKTIAASMGAEADIVFTEGYPALVNDPEMTGIARDSAGTFLGKEKVISLEKPSMGVDDFSFFLRERPGCYFMLGTASEDRENNFPLHHPRFNIDESILPAGAGILATIFLKITGML